MIHRHLQLRLFAAEVAHREAPQELQADQAAVVADADRSQPDTQALQGKEMTAAMAFWL